MPQEQRLVPLILFKRAPGQAIASGNNAAWICACRRVLPLVGRSGWLTGAALDTRVDCPDCGRHYFVVPEGKDRGPVVEVREI